MVGAASHTPGEPFHVGRAAAVLALVVAVFTPPPAPAHADQQSALLYSQFYPPAIFRDDTTTTRLEVVTDGTPTAVTAICNEQNLELNDQGIAGDRVAGDGVFTRDGLTSSDLEGPGFYMELQGLVGQGTCYTGTMTVAGDTGYVNLAAFSLIVSPERAGTPTVTVAPGVVASQFVLFITETEPMSHADGPGWPMVTLDFEAARHTMQDLFGDVFEVMVTAPGRQVYIPDSPYEVRAGFYLPHRVPAANMGERPVRQPDESRFLGVLYHPWGGGMLLGHEIGHVWSSYIAPALQLQDPFRECYCHWDPLSDVGGDMAAFTFFAVDDAGTPVGPTDMYALDRAPFHLQPNGDGTWRAVEPVEAYAPIDLYLMGLIPAEEVPPINVLRRADLSDPQRIVGIEVDTYTIDEIMAAAGGPRVPAYPDAPRRWDVAFVMISDMPFTDAEIAYHTLQAQMFTTGEISGPDYPYPPFAERTGGRGHLDADLSRFIGIGAAPALATPAAETTTTMTVTAVSSTATPATTAASMTSVAAITTTAAIGSDTAATGDDIWDTILWPIVTAGLVALVLAVARLVGSRQQRRRGSGTS